MLFWQYQVNQILHRIKRPIYTILQYPGSAKLGSERMVKEKEIGRKKGINPRNITQSLSARSYDCQGIEEAQRGGTKPPSRFSAWVTGERRRCHGRASTDRGGSVHILDLL